MNQLTIEISEDVLAQLQVLAAAKGKTIADYLRDAVSMQLWVDDVLKDGGRLIAKPKHRAAEVITARTTAKAS